MLDCVLEKNREEISDEVLEKNCETIIVGMKQVADMLDDGTDETGEKGDELAASIRPVLAATIATPAMTWAGCAAKAALYLYFTREDIAISLAGDVIRLAFG